MRIIFKKYIFFLVLCFIPVFILLMVEGILRLTNYGPNLNLFLVKDIGERKLYSLNPQVVRRYFAMQDFTTYVSKDMFLQPKLPDTYRIFCLGASTTIGYPYMYNGSYPSLLKDRLSVLFPEKNIEVINLGITAVTSYTVLDFIKELVKHQPDLILIYIGHNEFYGALGAGSTQFIGKNRLVIQWYLQLQKFKIFQLMRDTIHWMSNTFKTKNVYSRQRNLMEQMVRDKSIPFGGITYKSVMKSFQANLNEIVQIARRHRINLLLSTVTSNIRDQHPFVSLSRDSALSRKSKQLLSLVQELMNQKNYVEALIQLQQIVTIDPYRADAHFYLAQCYDHLKKIEEARRHFELARDFDGLRFRASSELNNIIRQICSNDQIPLVDIEKKFNEEAMDGIPGKDLFWEHVHPKLNGYFLMAKEMCQILAQYEMIVPKDKWNWNLDKTDSEYRQLAGVTPLDEEVADISMNILKSRWPFTYPEKSYRFEPQDEVQRTAWDYINGKLGWRSAHERLGNYYSQSKKLFEAEQEVLAVAKQFPYDPSFYLTVARLQTQQKKYREAAETYEKVLRFYEDPEVRVKAGIVYLEDQNFVNAVIEFERALSIENKTEKKFTPEQNIKLRFLLGLAYLKSGQTEAALEQLTFLQSIAPQSREYSQLLQDIRSGQRSISK